MLPPGLSSSQEVLKHYEDVYDHLIASGEAIPFLYPWASLGGAVVILYLVIDHRASSALAFSRFLVYGSVVYFAMWCTVNTKARNPASALGVGLISCFSTLWAGALMVFSDCQVDFRRLERDTSANSSDKVQSLDRHKQINGSPSLQTGNGHLRQRKSDAHIAPDVRDIDKNDSQNERLYWQEYPAVGFVARLDWVLDMLCSFRGVGWNWQIQGIPPLPAAVDAQFTGKPDHQQHGDDTVSRIGLKRYETRRALLRDAVTRLAIGYILQDIIKTLMSRDPYYWGYVDNPPPPNYLPTALSNSAAFVNTTRLVMALADLYLALSNVFALGPIFFSGVLGPQRLGVRGEAWMQPTMFGSFAPVLRKGLAGWWGGFWHQTFRFSFEAPTTRLLQVLNIDKRSQRGRAVSVFAAFFLSGCLHAAGSYSQLGDTYPLRGPMAFFLLQAVGILLQAWVAGRLADMGFVDKMPKALRQMANFVFTHVWLYYTGPLLIDDFARGGVWLYEPVPFSILRGLGFGAQGDTAWWRWNGILRWHRGKHWWDTGISL